MQLGFGFLLSNFGKVLTTPNRRQIADALLQACEATGTPLAVNLGSAAIISGNPEALALLTKLITTSTLLFGNRAELEAYCSATALGAVDASPSTNCKEEEEEDEDQDGEEDTAVDHGDEVTADLAEASSGVERSGDEGLHLGSSDRSGNDPDPTYLVQVLADRIAQAKLVDSRSQEATEGREEASHSSNSVSDTPASFKVKEKKILITDGANPVVIGTITATTAAAAATTTIAAALLLRYVCFGVNLIRRIYESSSRFSPVQSSIDQQGRNKHANNDSGHLWR